MNADHAVMKAIVDWRAEGHGVTLVMVTRTWGSSPRPAGALMAVRDDGATAGSVSGGCAEQDIVHRLRAGGLGVERPLRISYGADRDEAERLGLPCGGRLEVIAERVREGHGFDRILAALKRRETMVRRLWLDAGRVELLGEGNEFFCDERVLERRYGPAWRLLLIGAVDLARHVVHVGEQLDYEIVVCDPREEARQHWDLAQFPVDPRMPDEAAAALADDPHAAVVTLTHDPRLDDLALMQALTARAFYVGALGSRLTSAKRRERLLALGLPADAVARLRAPVGLAIGSRTPGEIAISILAEITAVRRSMVKASDSQALAEAP